ncbi:hypothetical protein EJB05_46623, partial [Eragrostis curvula]
MGLYGCQYCGGRAAIVFCPVDGARLCLHCDAAVHDATSLHPRAPLCDSCGAAPAALRCAATIAALCAACADRRATTGAGITTYTGCPGPTEMVRLLSAEAPQQPEELDAWLADHRALIFHDDESDILIDKLLLADVHGSSATDHWTDPPVVDPACLLQPPPPAETMTTESALLQSLALQSNTDHLLLDANTNNAFLPAISSDAVSLPQMTDLQTTMIADKPPQVDPTTATNKRQERDRAKLRYNEKKKNRRLERERASNKQQIREMVSSTRMHGG